MSTKTLRDAAHRLIPGGTQLLSKRPELFLPEQWPTFYQSASGVHVVDADGCRFVDVTIHAVGSCPLGYADPDVEEAVVAAVRAGSMASLNCPEEIELAELLCELHPFAEMVRYTRTGGEAMAVAVRVARAATGRSKVAFAGYHGWHDWYIAANLADQGALDGHLLPQIDPAGVPAALSGSALAFELENVESLERVVEAHGGELAAIILEPARYTLPDAGYLAKVKAIADGCGAVLIFDEITSGFRLHVGGAHQLIGVEPDVAVFAKAMSNGYPMGAIIGTRSVMEAAATSFISSTYWTERIGPTAAIATIRKLRAHDVPTRLAATGDRMRAGWEGAAGRHGLDIATRGVAPLPSFGLAYGERSGALATLYTQEMLDRGYLASAAFYASYAHTDAVVDAALEATDEAFATLAEAVDAGDAEARLRGPVAYAGLRRRQS